jgi:hypothetical protein
LRLLRENGLTLFFLGLFLVTVAAQAAVGVAGYNHDQIAHHGEPISIGSYLVNSTFAAALMENWQSEFLQTLLFVCATIWLVQRGSPESKELGDEGMRSDEEEMVGEHARDDSPKWARAGGVRRALYGHSLALVVGGIFIGSWLAQALTGRVSYNAQQLDHQEAPVSFPAYLVTPDFWERTLQNWQSEFLALAASTILAVYLRQRGSTQSKPVGRPHDETAIQEA